MPEAFSSQLLKEVYNYSFELKAYEPGQSMSSEEGDRVLVCEQSPSFGLDHLEEFDFIISLSAWGSCAVVNDKDKESSIADIQHMRRRESIAMTPGHCLHLLQDILKQENETQSLSSSLLTNQERQKVKDQVVQSIREVTGAETSALLGSCGLSVQYAILMGLVDNAFSQYQGKKIHLIVPPNCYGGTNDQARRVAAVTKNVQVVDLPVDRGQDMVESLERVLAQVAESDAVPLIIAEIPTNPRVEVPDLLKLKEVLVKERVTPQGSKAVAPVFILDQTFCPNVHFLGEENILAPIQTITYVSGSKFPSGGLCTAGYCVANQRAKNLMPKIEAHLKLCDNEASDHQLIVLQKQMPSMVDRISQAYKNTRLFVDYISEVLPQAKINFVSEELAQQGFTPSVFSLDLPTQGRDDLERESYKRQLNAKLIDDMIKNIPHESKHCVSYGQLKGCYWTIPATSTQGTTKEHDKDYIVRVAVSPQMDIEKHKAVFQSFVNALSL